MSAQPGYLNKTWCNFYAECKKGSECPDALTPAVRLAAVARGEPCAVWFFELDCFVPIIPGAGGHKA